MKKIISVILIIAMTAVFCSCDSGDISLGVGSGTPGVVDALDWSEFEDLKQKVGIETDPDKRAMMMHRMEDLIMDAGIAIPLFHSSANYVSREYLEGIIPGYMSDIFYPRVHRMDVDPSTPVNLCIGGEKPSLDPCSLAETTIDNYCAFLFGGLTMPGADGETTFNFAESVDISDDRKTYTFTMREGLKWSDGEVLDARDFEYTWKRMVDPNTGSPLGYMLAMVDGYPDNLNVHATEDGRQFIVQLTAPCSYFLDECSCAFLSPVPRHYVEPFDSISSFAWAAEAGFPCCGPYILESWNHNESMKLKRNPDYWDAESILPEAVNLMLNTDGTAAHAAYLAGDIDATEMLTGEIAVTYYGTPELHLIDSIATEMLVFNVKSRIFAGMTAEEAATFRKALGFCIDRDFLVQVVSGGLDTPATRLVAPFCPCGCDYLFGETPGYSYPLGNGYYKVEADLDEARRMLSSIGFEFGSDGKLKESVTFEMSTNSATSTLIACLQADFAQLGIIAKISTIDAGLYWNELDSGNFEAARSNWISDFPDPIGMYDCFSMNSPNNWCQLGR